MTDAPPVIRVHRSLMKGLRSFDADRLRWLDEATALGSLTGLRMGPVTTWVVSDPDTARSMLVTDDDAWTRPPATRSPVRVGVGENLFTLPDKRWMRFQPLVAPAFRRNALDSRLAGIDELIEQELGAIPVGRTIDLELAMGRLSLRLAAWVLLGERIAAERAEAVVTSQREVVAWVGEQVGRVTGFIPFAVGPRARKMRRSQAVLNAYADEVISRARSKARADDDVLGALLNARPSGKALGTEALRGHVLGLLLAGNETTTAALLWMLVHGARQPDEWAKVALHPDRHASGFVTESLRLTPAVWGIPRTPIKPGVTLTSGAASTRVRRGQLATVYLRAINRDPSRWPDPLRFDPARHLAGAKEQKRALIPFGLGPRGCIGQHLALAEMHAALPALARRGAVEIDGPAAEDASFALRVRGGLAGRFTSVQPAGEADSVVR
jgi:cytochrome P450